MNCEHCHREKDVTINPETDERVIVARMKIAQAMAVPEPDERQLNKQPLHIA